MATPGATPAAPSTTTDSDKLEMGDGNKLEDRVKTAKDVTDKEVTTVTLITPPPPQFSNFMFALHLRTSGTL